MLEQIHREKKPRGVYSGHFPPLEGERKKEALFGVWGRK
jgi:hypothetical protein